MTESQVDHVWSSTVSSFGGTLLQPRPSFPRVVSEESNFPLSNSLASETDPTLTSTTPAFILDQGRNRSKSNDDNDDIEYYYFYKNEQLTFLWIMFAMIVIGNASVLIHTQVVKQNKNSRMSFFIMHLALADLLVGIINVPTDIAWRTTVGFYAGNVACKVVKFMQVLVTYASTYVLVSLSIDRYDAIKNPLNFSRRWKRARLLITCAWGLSFIFSIPAVFLNEVRMIKGHPQCWINLQPWQWQLYITLVAISLFLIPAIIIASCYSVIVCIIWQKGRSMAPVPKSTTKSGSVRTTMFQRSSSGESTAVSTSISRAEQENNELKRASSRGVIPRAKIKSVKMTLVIVFVFILCWTPYFLWDLLQVYGYIPLSQTTIAVSTFIQSMAPLNSAANPLIYYLFTTHFCRRIR